MSAAAWWLILATSMAALGIWLSLPGFGRRARVGGLVISLLSLGLFAGQVPSLGSWSRDALFWILAGLTIVSAAGTITFRNPVYCALWFALSLLGTAALFLFQGSQFLAMATVVVYAGAILVTFLFVLMLAQPKGQAAYDRVSWEGLLAAMTGALLVGILTMVISSSLTAGLAGNLPHTEELSDILAQEHMQNLGAQLFSKHLLSVEVAGTLLLVALVGAIAISARSESATFASKEN